MQIELDLLRSLGGIEKKYNKNEIIFNEGENAYYYYQIIEGSTIMFNSNDDGKEFTQRIFFDGDSFGEPLLFINECYPSSAISIVESHIIKLSKEIFLNLLHRDNEIQRSFLNLLAYKIYSKANTLKEIVNQNPEHRIIAFLNHYKEHNLSNRDRVLIPYTRQEIGNFTGLRVETVIRALSKLNKSKKVEIVNHKIFF